MSTSVRARLIEMFKAETIRSSDLASLAGSLGANAHRLSDTAEVAQELFDLLIETCLEATPDARARLERAVTALRPKPNARAAAEGVESKRFGVVLAVNRAIEDWRFSVLESRPVDGFPLSVFEKVPIEDIATRLIQALGRVDPAFSDAHATAVELLKAVPQAQDLEGVESVHPSAFAICAKLSLQVRAFGDAQSDRDANRRGVKGAATVGAVDRLSSVYRLAYEKRSTAR